MSGPGTFLKEMTAALGIPPCKGCGRRAEAIDAFYRKVTDMIKPAATTALPSVEGVFYQLGSSIQVTKTGVAENRTLRLSHFLIDPASKLPPMKLGDDKVVILLGQGASADPAVATLNAAIDAAVEAYVQATKV